MSILKLFKKREPKILENTIVNSTNIVKISYYGEHRFYLGSIDAYFQSNSGHERKCRLYAKGEGTATFYIAGKKYEIKIEPFVYLDEYNSNNEAYMGACEMDKDFITEKLKKGIVEKISYSLHNMEEKEIKDAFDNQKITLSINFEVDKSDLFRYKNSDY